MKKRHGFVSNSSSSSFIIIHAGKIPILEYGNDEVAEGDDTSIDINFLIYQLEQAKLNGEEKVTFYFGGGMD